MDHELLKAISVFATVHDDHLRSLAGLMSETSVPQGAAIVKQGACSYDFFAIVEGNADVLRDGKKISTLQAGECFGEIGVMERRPRMATVVATTPMRLVTLTHWDLDRLGAGVLLSIQDQISQRLVVHVE